MQVWYAGKYVNDIHLHENGDATGVLQQIYNWRYLYNSATCDIIKNTEKHVYFERG